MSRELAVMPYLQRDGNCLFFAFEFCMYNAENKHYEIILSTVNKMTSENNFIFTSLSRIFIFLRLILQQFYNQILTGYQLVNYCYELVNIACKFVNIICVCIIISQTHLTYSFSEKNCIIFAKFLHEILSLQLYYKLNV